MKIHISRIHENNRPIHHVCEVCGKGFSAPSMLAQHSFIHADKNKIKVKCEICGKWSKHQNAYRNHRKRHNETPLKCPHCEKVVYFASELRLHISQFHSLRQHQCTICNKSFTRPIRLKVCLFYNKIISIKTKVSMKFIFSHLKKQEHMATHTNESVYNCLYCTKTFKGNSNRYDHLRRQHPNEWNLYHNKRKSKQELS